MSPSHRGQATPDRDDYDPESPAAAPRRSGGAHRAGGPRGRADEQPPYPGDYASRPDDDYASRPDDGYAARPDDGYPPRGYVRRRDVSYPPGPQDGYASARDYPPRRADSYAPRPDDELTRDYPRRRGDDYAARPDDAYPPPRDYPRRRPDEYSARSDEGFAPRRRDSHASPEDDYQATRDYPPRRADRYASRPDDDNRPARDYPPRPAESYAPRPDDDYAPTRDPQRRRADGYAPMPDDLYAPRPDDGHAPRRADRYPQPPDDSYAPTREYQRRPADGYPPARDYAPRRADGYAPRPDDEYRSRRDDGYGQRQADGHAPRQAPRQAEGYPPRPDRDLAAAAPQPPRTDRASDPAGASLVKSSGVMAIGTLASRVTGMIRTFVLIAAIGTFALGNAYQYANGLPNTVYNLAIGGVLTAVIVPLLVNAAKRDSDGGAGYDQRMFTLVTIILGLVTIVATLAAAPIALAYDREAAGNEHHLVIIFAYFFIPQIFFYGASSLAGAILNARGHFAAPAWTPVVNNIVVIAVSVAFMVIVGTSGSVAAGNVSTTEIWFLGIGTTVGIVAQTIALIPALRKVGFRWRPTFNFRRYEIREIGRMSGWLFGYVLTTQVAFWVTAAISSTADRWAYTNHYTVGIGYSAYTNAWLLFQLPYAIVGISVITALLPRMSANASDRRYDLVRADFSAGVRLGSVIVAPAALVLAVLGPALGVVLLSWGVNTARSAAYLGLVFSVFSLGLMPYMLFQLQLRVFYSLHDSRTPALIGLLTMAVNIATNVAALLIFPKTEVVAALGAGFGLANVTGTLVAWRVLSKRLHGLGGRQIGASLLRMHAAALPATLFALAVAVASTAALSTPTETHLRAAIIDAMIVIVGGGGALGLYFAMAKILHVKELTELLGSVRSRLGTAR